MFKKIGEMYLKQLRLLNNPVEDIKNKTHRQCKMSQFIYYVEGGWKKIYGNKVLTKLKDCFSAIIEILGLLLNLLKYICTFCLWIICIPFIVIKLIFLKRIYINIKDSEQFKSFTDRVKTAQIVDD